MPEQLYSDLVETLTEMHEEGLTPSKIVIAQKYKDQFLNHIKAIFNLDKDPKDYSDYRFCGVPVVFDCLADNIVFFVRSVETDTWYAPLD